MNFLDGKIVEQEGKAVWREDKAFGLKSAAVALTGGLRPCKARSDSAGEDTGGSGCDCAGTEQDRGKDSLTLTPVEFTLCVPPHSGLPWQSWVGRHVVLGIRPEHLRIRPAAAEGFAGMSVRVESIEALGSLVDVVAVTALCHRLIARLDAREELVAGSDVVLYADIRDVCFFEPGETGMNLSLTNESSHALA